MIEVAKIRLNEAIDVGVDPVSIERLLSEMIATTDCLEPRSSIRAERFVEGLSPAVGEGPAPKRSRHAPDSDQSEPESELCCGTVRNRNRTGVFCLSPQSESTTHLIL